MKAERLDFISAAYRSILLREPDADGAAFFSARLSEGQLDYAGVLSALLGSREFYLRRGQIMDRYQHSDANAFFNEVSQFGEVSTLLRAMISASSSDNLVVDVGVRGREGSNSYDLMRWLGWRGLLIEANERLNEQIRREFEGLDYKIVNIAVSDYVGTATFHIGSSDGVSSLNEESVLRFGNSGGTVEVSVDKLHSVLAAHSIPKRFGLLSIDIEGEDIRVLNNLIGESDYRPDWIILEARVDGEYAPGQIGLIGQFDIDYALVGATAANLIFKRRL